MFGNYDIIQTIGQGGMSIVYLAQDTSLDRTVALKILKDDLRMHENVVARFQREAEAYATLDHPNIIQIYSVGSIGRIPYIAMEHIDGEALSRTMKRERRIPWRRALEISKHIAKALACAHEAKIIHRDIKPGNILVEKGGKVYVTDFGIAKVLTAETQLTIDGSRLGTPHYMSPERCQNKEITPSSDVYSLGVLLFQMISGRLPYEAPTPVSLIRKITAEPPTRLHEYVADIPANVERFVAFLLEKDPKQRPASGAELVALIERVEQGKPLVDDETRLGDALQELRGSFATPTPGSAFPADSPTTGFDKQKKQRSLSEHWAGLSENIRAAFIALPLVIVAAVAGTFFAVQLNEGFAPEGLRSAQPSVDQWRQSKHAASIVEESPGVAVARIDLRDFTPIVGGSIAGSSNLFVQLKGKSRSSRSGQAALFILDPEMREVRLAVSPVKAAVPYTFVPVPAVQMGFSARASSVLYPGEIEDVQGNRQAALLEWDFLNGYATPRYTAARLARGDDSSSRIPQAFGAIAVNPSGSSITVACTETGTSDSWFLLKGGGITNGESTNINITKPGPLIGSVQYAPNGTWIAYTREQRPGLRSLWSVDLRGALYKESMLTQGDLVVLPGGINRRTGSIVVSQTDSEGDRVLEVFDPYAGKLPLELGQADSAVWHPSGDSLVAIAPDRKGKRQLWLIEAREPFTRTQLTYLNAGTSALCIVSGDGRWAVSSVEGTEQPSIVFAGISAGNLR